MRNKKWTWLVHTNPKIRHGTSLLSAVRSLLKRLHIGIAWPKNTNSEAFARRTVTASDSICSADGVSLRFSYIMLFKLKCRRELEL